MKPIGEMTAGEVLHAYCTERMRRSSVRSLDLGAPPPSTVAGDRFETLALLCRDVPRVILDFVTALTVGVIDGEQVAEEHDPFFGVIRVRRARPISPGHAARLVGLDGATARRLQSEAEATIAERLGEWRGRARADRDSAVADAQARAASGPGAKLDALVRSLGPNWSMRGRKK